MRQSSRPFFPIDQGTVSIAVTATTGRVALAATTTHYLLTNLGSDTVFARFGNSAITATVPSGATGGSFPVLSGEIIIVPAPVTPPTHVAAIANSTTATLFITAGEGN